MPSLKAFKKTGGFLYDPEDIKKYEVVILQKLNYKLDYLTSYDIIKFVINYGITLEAQFLKDYSISIISMNQFIRDYFTLSFFLLEELISEIETVKFSQLQIACACLMMASSFKYTFIDVDDLLFNHFRLNAEEIVFVFNELKLYFLIIFYFINSKY